MVRVHVDGLFEKVSFQTAFEGDTAPEIYRSKFHMFCAN